MRTQAAVIGAGPTGLIAAEVISRNGFDTTVFEEHNQIGEPNHCAGIISVEGFDRLGIHLDDSFYLNTIKGGRIYSADGTCIEVKDKKPRAHIIDRSKFDAYLGEKAVSSGVDIKTDTRVNEIVSNKKGIIGLRTKNYSCKTDVLINAEGATGRLLASAGMDTGQEGVLNGYNVDISGERIELDLVEVWFNNEVSNGFFAWVVPVDDETVRVGLGTRDPDGYTTIRKFIKKRFGDVNVPPIHGGLICTGGPVKWTTHLNMLLVGDVAGQVKPTTGGGVVIGSLCAKLAGKAASTYLTTNVQRDLDWYDTEWKRLYGRK